MRRIALVCLTLAVAGCRCEKVNKIPASLQVTPNALDFDAVKNGDTVGRTLKLEAKTSTDVVISALAVTNGGEPGGIEGFTLKTEPITIAPLGSETLSVAFHPTALQAYAAMLTLTTNDPDQPTVRVPLLGQGSKPTMKVVPECDGMIGCKGAADAGPPASIDFGMEPLNRPMLPDASKLPLVLLTNEGDVKLVVNRVAITGPDAAAFTIYPNPVIPTPLEYEASAGVNFPIRFKPTSEAKLTYSADFVAEGDDPDHPTATVHLSGTLLPNAAPTVCANLISVSPIDDSPRNYLSLWPQLLTVPVGGYDFSSTRDVEPRSTVVFSALSDTDITHCTTDLEDGRQGLTYQWRIVTAPMGSPALGTSATDRFTFTPIVTGEYRLELTVTDTKASSTVVPIKFNVALKKDLSVQLQWAGFAGTDLDLHLVRPSSVANPSDPWSGPFSFFNEGPNSTHTSGDLNGYANTKNPLWGSGLNFDWGTLGDPDNPKLNIDDIGDSNLLESISLNYPENDAKCDGGRCSYRIYVHYVRDYRNNPGPACIVDGGAGCEDGDACSCTGGNRCVATPPPDGGRPIGAAECRPAPKPTVSIFLKGSATPAATVPLPPDEILLGAPCVMLYVADVRWPSQQEIGTLPDGGTPPADVLVKGLDAGLARFGKRQPADFRQCTPDDSITQWYSRQP